MAELVTRKGDRVIYKDEVTTNQVFSLTRQSKVNGKVDEKASSDALAKLLVEKIITSDSREITERVEIVGYIGSMNSKDGLKIIKELGKVLSDEEVEDPKELEIV